MTGTLVAHKGSPDSGGSFWDQGGYPPDEVVPLDSRLAAFRAKQGALCELFCRERKWLEFQPFDATAAIKCQPRLRSSQFSEGQWVNRCDYTFVFEADTVFFGSVECCADDAEFDPVDESWDVEQADDAARTYRLSHSVGAAFRDSYTPEGAVDEYGWELAREKVLARLGYQQSKLTQADALNLSSFGGYNHARAVTENRADGVYRVTETWLCFDPEGGPAAVEDYTVTTRVQTGQATVSVDGSIAGLLERNGSFAISTTKYQNAAAKWVTVAGLLLSRAQAASGLTLNPVALSLQTAINELTGVITYQCEFDSRFSFGGAVRAEVTLQDQNAADAFAAIPVVARPAGPVLQNIGSATETSRTVTIDLQFPALAYGGVVGTRPDVSALLLAYRPVAAQVFVARDEENWQLVSGRYVRTTTFVYQ